MKSKKVRPARRQTYKKIANHFKDIDFNKLSRQSGFKKRKEKKIKGKSMIISFMMMAIQGDNTFEQWAQEIGLSLNKILSKQAVCKRVTGCFTAFSLSVLNKVFAHHVKQIGSKIQTKAKLKRYQQILIQDSTIIKLPQWLSKIYPGAHSKGQAKSLIRIQLIIEVHTHKIVQFQITPYSKNDQSMSGLIYTVANKGDMVLRDLGYFVLDVLEQLQKRKACFVTRIKPGIKVFDIKTEKEIDLLKLLRKKGKIDQWVFVSNKSKIPLRLVAVKLPDEIANEKIRKKKCSRDKRLHHDKRYYALMRYTIYLTTEQQTELTFEEVTKIYSLRWRIENLFKTWKSSLHLQQLMPGSVKMSKARADSILYLMLIFIMQFQMKIYNELRRSFERQKRAIHLSLTKLSKFIIIHFNEILQMNTKQFNDTIAYYCSYDKRKDRLNFIQKLKLS
jgi:Transposase DDE domain